MKYTVIIEKDHSSYSAYAPDLPGCIAAAESKEEVRKLITEAVGLYVEEMKKDGIPLPAPQHSGVAESPSAYGEEGEVETVDVVASWLGEATPSLEERQLDGNLEEMEGENSEEPDWEFNRERELDSVARERMLIREDQEGELPPEDREW